MVLEQSSVVGYSSLTQQNKNDLERTQKSFAKLVMKNKHVNYDAALEAPNLESLEDRRQELALRWAPNCTKIQNSKISLLKNYQSDQQETQNNTIYHPALQKETINQAYST